MAGTSIKLIVEVVDAHDLTPKDGVGTSSPYVIVDFAGQRRQTGIKHRELNPVWKEKLEFVLSDLNDMAEEELEVELYNDLSCGGAGRSDFLGRVKLQGNEIPEMVDMCVRYFPLKMKSIFHPIKGELGLKLHYVEEPIQPTGEEKPTEPPAEGVSLGEEKHTEPPVEAALPGKEKPTEPLAEAPQLGEADTAQSLGPAENEPREPPFEDPATGGQETLEPQPEIPQEEVEKLVEPAAKAAFPEDDKPAGEKDEDFIPAEEELPEEAPQMSQLPVVEKPAEPPVETPPTAAENLVEPAAEAPLPEDDKQAGEKDEDFQPAEKDEDFQPAEEEVPEEAPQASEPPQAEKPAEPPVDTPPTAAENLVEPAAEAPPPEDDKPAGKDDKDFQRAEEEVPEEAPHVSPPPGVENPTEPLIETPPAGVEKVAEIVAEIPVLGEDSPRDKQSETPPPLEEESREPVSDEPREPLSEAPISVEERFPEGPTEALALSETFLIICAVGVSAYWVIWFCYSILSFFFCLLEHTVFYLM